MYCLQIDSIDENNNNGFRSLDLGLRVSGNVDLHGKGLSQRLNLSLAFVLSFLLRQMLNDLLSYRSLFAYSFLYYYAGFLVIGFFICSELSKFSPNSIRTSSNCVSPSVAKNESKVEFCIMRRTMNMIMILRTGRGIKE